MRTLPRDVAAFTGRDDELDHLTRAVGPGEVIVIHTVDGMPGVGKTALATRAANLLAPRFPDGQLFVRLHAHTPGQHPADPSEVLAALLASRGIPPQLIPQSLDEREAMWRDHAAGKRILLVLDDAADSTQIEPLLPASAGCLVLVTSRRRLIALDGADPLPLEVLRPEQAAHLFTRLARRTLDPSEHHALHRAVHLCGHLPLAIALLAGRLAHHPAWTITEFTDEFATAQDRLGELEAGSRAVVTAFDLSYTDLPPARQRLFRRLGLHPGTDTDAYSTAALANIPLNQARRELRALYTDHLIDEPTPGRYRLHDLIRTYTRTLTVQDPAEDREHTTLRLLDYYRHTAQTADRHLTRFTRPTTPATATPPAAAPDLTTREQALTWLRTEQTNLLAATHHAATHQHHTHTVALTAAMATLLLQDGPWHQAATLHQRAATTAHHRTHPLDEADALHDLGRVRRLTGEYGAAAGLQGRALALYRGLGDRLGEANALNDLGYVRCAVGEYGAAIDLLERALALYRGLGDRLGEANTLIDLGRVCYLVGEHGAAADRQEGALALHRGLGDRLGEANALHDLGRVRQAVGEYGAAAGLLEQAVALYRDLDNRLGEANALTALGYLRQAVGGYGAAADLLEQALALFRELGHRLGEANASTALGYVRYLVGEYGAAAGLLERALALYRDLGDRLGEANALNNLGRVSYLVGEYGAAAGLLERALALYRDLGNRLREANALNSMGALLAEAAGPRESLTVYQQALLLAREVAAPLEEARALEGTARCQARTGEHEAALPNLRQAVTIYQDLGAPEADSATALLVTLEAEAPRNDTR
ncbi:ATP-binding protein [Streptomyces sp. NBC_01751]|uniref:ATP-binding protein n=1 Tax=Streptomyces sp. NBC_01751 TaxID=2975929 RepID=UPI002DD9F7D4|nr:tetratricopeptide repeat protein [Streptomyces sp. NBC_01751]WSD22083.1 tetratricopeptide repeat protein [Streptomyces sp. NBC_01751]WSD29893.1 tetratricopeptide repeat protein [Streptomyces sp. NBC_01751]